MKPRSLKDVTRAYNAHLEMLASEHGDLIDSAAPEDRPVVRAMVDAMSSFEASVRMLKELDIDFEVT